MVRCARRHTFDVARQGYVSLLGPDHPTGSGDTAAMVEARDAFLGAGHYTALADAVTAACGRTAAATHGGCVVDLGAGTGYYLRRVLDRLEASAGLALDVSRYAARRAARAHPRIGAVVGDVWRDLPIRTRAAQVVLSVFAPRNGPEMRRILRPDGAGVVVTPAAGHLAELIAPLGMLRVDTRKSERLHEQLGPHLAETDRQAVDIPLELRHDAVMELVAMGPTAWHASREEMASRVGALPDPVAVTASFVLSVHRPPAAR